MTRGHLRAVTFSLLLLLPATRAQACGPNELTAAIAAAQELNKIAEPALGRLLSCPNERQAALQWLSFFRTMTGGPRITALPRTTGRVAAPGKTAAIQAAYEGQLLKLKNHLDSGDPDVAQEPLAYLAVGRGLFRDGNFAEGRTYFENLLRLAPDQPAYEVEYLFSFIWAGDYPNAERRFRFVRTEGTAPEFNAAIARGRELLKAKGYSEGSRANAALEAKAPEPAYRGALEGMTIKDQLLRQTARVKYHGIIDVGLDHHVLREQVYDESSISSDIAYVGASLPLGRYVDTSLNVGYLTTGALHAVGRASMRVKGPRHLFVGLGGQRRPLYEDRPLPDLAIALLEDSAYFEAGVFDWGQLTTRLVRDVGNVAYERHEAALDRSLRRFDQGAGALRLLAGASYEARPRPSDAYDTDRRRLGATLGILAQHETPGVWSASARMAYDLTQAQPFGDSSWSAFSGISSQVNLEAWLNDAWRLGGAFGYGGRETGHPHRTFENRFLAMIYLSLAADKPPTK